MARYSDFVVRQIQENTGSLGRIPFLYFQPTCASLKNNEPYTLTIETNKSK
jgi:hypothetical protein